MKIFDHNSEKYLQVDGAKIYYETSGKEDSPALLFLHGGFGDIEDFNTILPDLDKEFQIIGIDSRGQGKSTLGLNELTYEQIQKDVERVLEHLNIGNFSIISFSDGGIVAYRLAALTSLKIKKLVTIGATWHLKNIESTREIFLKVTGESWRKKFPATYDAYQKLNSEPNFDSLAKASVKMWIAPNLSGHPNEAVKNISCPLPIIRGDDDHLVSPKTVVELAGLVKNSRLLIIP